MGQPQDRKWTVDLRARSEDGEWFYDEDTAAQRTIEAYLELATIQHREGGAFVVAPIRTQIAAEPDALTPDPVWVNMGLVVEHKFVPPVRQRVSQVVGAADTGGDTNGALPGPGAVTELAAAQDERNAVFAREMRDEDEAAVAAELDEADEPSAVMAQPTDPTETPKPLDPSRLMPEMH